MKLTKKKAQRSKKVLARKPDSTFYVKETTYIEEYPGGPKRPYEKFHSVDNFTSS